MNGLIFRIYIGIILLFALIINVNELIYLVCLILIIEAITNHKIIHVISKKRYGQNFKQYYFNSDTDSSYDYKYSLEAERIFRILISSALFISVYFFQKELWFIPWLIAYLILFAGLSKWCPLSIFLISIGFKRSDESYVDGHFSFSWERSIALKITGIVTWVTLLICLILGATIIHDMESQYRIIYTARANVLSRNVKNLLEKNSNMPDSMIIQKIKPYLDELEFTAIEIITMKKRLWIGKKHSNSIFRVNVFRLSSSSINQLGEGIQLKAYHPPWHIIMSSNRSKLFIAIGLAFVVFCAFLIFVIHNTITSPFRKLIDATKKVSEGNLLTRVNIKSEDEFGQLASFFNDMIKQIEDQNNKLVASQEEYRKMRDAAINASNVKSDFLANMSHEIRTPMNAIQGYGDLLKEVIEDEEQKEYIDIINKSGDNLLRLIDDILDLSKIEAGKLEIKPEPLDIKEIVNEIADIFNLKTKDKGIKLIVENDPDIPSNLLLDGVRIRQILFNLVGNAIKFTSKGYVLIFTKCRKSKNEKKASLLFAVKDTGIGIPTEQLDDIFNPFKQQDGQSTREYGGTGLGLSISKRLVNIMGGTIEVSSKKGKGSIFKIILKNIPRADVEYDDEEDEIQHQIPSIADDTIKLLHDNIVFKKGKKTLLIVDDVTTNRNLIKKFLKSVNNINILEADNGLEVIQLAQKYHPELIFMDIKIPLLDGIKATQRLRKDPKTADIHIIALTASAMKSEQSLIAESGFDGFIPKPVKKTSIIKAIEKVISLEYATETPEQKKTPPKTVESLTLSTKDQTQLKQQLSQLHNNWLEIKDTCIISQIEKFAHDVHATAERFNNDTLDDYAALLLEKTRYDIGQLNPVLKKFTSIAKSCIT
ncbi:MAG: response regulator [Methylococcales bacterium]|jgi:signal transduction histidine kinase/DNA-binding NarL/FixJ family response regulator|nr:response regulator [Methylococcales bacterium]MBT7410714.1 response regulator [Methylococcales bacterium]